MAVARRKRHKAGQSQHKFAFDGGLRIKVRCHGCFEGLIIFLGLYDIHDRFGAAAVFGQDVD